MCVLTYQVNVELRNRDDVIQSLEKRCVAAESFTTEHNDLFAIQSVQLSELQTRVALVDIALKTANNDRYWLLVTLIFLLLISVASYSALYYLGASWIYLNVPQSPPQLKNTAMEILPVRAHTLTFNESVFDISVLVQGDLAIGISLSADRNGTEEDYYSESVDTGAVGSNGVSSPRVSAYNVPSIPDKIDSVPLVVSVNNIAFIEESLEKQELIEISNFDTDGIGATTDQHVFVTLIPTEFMALDRADIVTESEYGLPLDVSIIDHPVRMDYDGSFESIVLVDTSLEKHDGEVQLPSNVPFETIYMDFKTNNIEEAASEQHALATDEAPASVETALFDHHGDNHKQSSSIVFFAVFLIALAFAWWIYFSCGPSERLSNPIPMIPVPATSHISKLAMLAVRAPSAPRSRRRITVLV